MIKHLPSEATRPFAEFAFDASARSFWQRFLRPRPYSPVWQRYRGARLLWRTARAMEGQPRWVPFALVIHELFARHPFVRFVDRRRALTKGAAIEAPAPTERT